MVDQQVERVLRAVPQADAAEPPRVLLHATGDARRMGFILLATVAIVALLKWASAFFIPLAIGLVFHYALSPIVDRMARLRIPRAVGAGVLVVGMLVGSGAAVWSLADDANAIISSLPSAAQRLRAVLDEKMRQGGPLQPVQRAADELAKVADGAGRSAPPSPRGVQRVRVEKPQFDIGEHLWSGAMGLATLAGQVVLVTFLTYFLLVSGDSFRRKLVKISGPGLGQKKLTVQALEEINVQIQRYLLVQLVTSVGVGIASGAAFAWLGLSHAAAWGVAAGVLNLVPYAGSILVALGSGAAAFVQTGTAELPLMVVGATLVLHTVTGNLLVPWLTSAASRINAVAVFVGVLFWAWLWGIAGLLLGVPVMMVIKAVCDRVDHLKPVGELLGN